MTESLSPYLLLYTSTSSKDSERKTDLAFFLKRQILVYTVPYTARNGFLFSFCLHCVLYTYSTFSTA